MHITQNNIKSRIQILIFLLKSSNILPPKITFPNLFPKHDFTNYKYVHILYKITNLQFQLPNYIHCTK